MNNDQFRSLYKDRPDDSAISRPSTSSSQALGTKRSKDRSSFSSVYKRSAFIPPTVKKFKTKDPKGSKIASGYVDRAKERAQAEADSQDERAKQIGELEEQLKQKNISRSEFEARRDAITAGDITATHLVKGLDRKLLERIRQGENVMETSSPEDAVDADIDDQLDKLEDAEVEVTERRKQDTQKQGTLAPSLVAGRKRTRDEIMAEMKAQRKAAAEAKAAAEPELDHRWRSTAEKQTNRIEIDRKGREVLVIVDEDGFVKKKLRRPAPVEARPEEQVIGRNLPGVVLGADIVLPQAHDLPAVAAQTNESDDDIFEGAGTDYDPLGDEDDESQSEGEGDNHTNARAQEDATDKSSRQTDNDQKLRSRNYFNEKPTAEEAQPQSHFSGVEAVIAKAARLASTLQDTSNEEQDKAAAERRAKHAAMLNTRDRDLEDMDLGFGGSRFEDGEDENTGKAVHLSEWSEKVKDDRKGRSKAPGKKHNSRK